jgi:hypothetical protein
MKATKKEYYRLCSFLSRDLNPVKKTELFYFNSGDYNKDKQKAKSYRPGYRFVYLSKRTFNTFGEALKTR